MLNNKEPINILSLFSGIGAFEEGLDNLKIPYNLVNYCEFDNQVAKSYSILRNVSEKLNLGNIYNVNEKLIKPFNLMTYGFPCQSFSFQGNRKGFDDPEKGPLFFESMRIVKHHKPKYLIAENVKGLLSNNKGETFKTILKTLEDLGYNNYYKVMKSHLFDIPQARERVFIVSIRKDIDKKCFNFPKGEFSKKTIADILDKDEYGLHLNNRQPPIQSMQKYINTDYYTKEYKSLSNVKKLFDGNKEGFFSSGFSSHRVYSIHGFSPTLTTKNDSIYYELNGRLTNRERFALQGFPKKYVDKLLVNGIPNGKITLMSGNTITVNVIQAILYELLLSQEEICEISFDVNRIWGNLLYIQGIHKNAYKWYHFLSLLWTKNLNKTKLKRFCLIFYIKKEFKI